MDSNSTVKPHLEPSVAAGSAAQVLGASLETRSADRTRAAVAGTCFVVAAVAAVVGLALYQPLLADHRYVLRGGSDGSVKVGALLELVLVGGVIGTGVALYPVLRRVGESLALTYVCGRLLEAMAIVLGLVSVLGVVSLRSGRPTGVGERELLGASASLVAVHDWTFLVGPGVVIGANTFVLALLVLRGSLVPRWIAVLGLIGGPMVFASSVAVMFGIYDQVSPWAMIAAIPVTAWEMSFAVRLIVRGFGSRHAGAAPSGPATDPAGQLLA